MKKRNNLCGHCNEPSIGWCSCGVKVCVKHWDWHNQQPHHNAPSKEPTHDQRPFREAVLKEALEHAKQALEVTARVDIYTDPRAGVIIACRVSKVALAKIEAVLSHPKLSEGDNAARPK